MQKKEVHVHMLYCLLIPADTLKDRSSFGAKGHDEERSLGAIVTLRDIVVAEQRYVATMIDCF